MAVWVSALSLYGLLSPSIGGKLQGEFYAATPLTTHLCHVAVGYFIWDLLVCYDQGLEFVVHGLACLCVFAGAMVRQVGGGAQATLAFWRLILTFSSPLHPTPPAAFFASHGHGDASV